MGKKKIAVLLVLTGFILLCWPGVNFADIIPSEQIDIFAFKLGIRPDMDTVQQNEVKGLTRFTGTVIKTCTLTDLGFYGVKEGDMVEVTSMEDGRWKSKMLSTGEEKIFKLDIDWEKEG